MHGANIQHSDQPYFIDDARSRGGGIPPLHATSGLALFLAFVDAFDLLCESGLKAEAGGLPFARNECPPGSFSAMGQRGR